MLIIGRHPAHWLALVAVLGLCAKEHAAIAAPSDSQPVGLRVTYTAPAICPSAAEFERAVLARLTVPVSFTADTPTKLFDVQLVADAHGVEAELVVREGRGSTGAQPESARHFRTETCDQAVQALAVVAALAVDPNAATNERNAEFGTADPTPAVLPVAPPASPAQRERRLPPSVSRASPATPATRLQPEPKASAARTLRTDAQLRIGSTWGPASVALLSAGLGVAVEGSRVGSSFPRVALAVEAASTRVGPAATEGTFTWIVGRARLCPWRRYFGASFALDACVAVDGGLLRVSGDPGSPHPLERNRPWLALGAEPELRYRRSGYFASFAVAGLAPLIRDRFLFDSGHLVHEVPPVVLSLSASAGHEF